jgi:4,5-dihydroxyphthalate decarboxylase
MRIAPAVTQTTKTALTLVISDYDHVRDLASGAIEVEGLALNVQTFPIQEIFHRFTLFREWDVSEMSLGMYVSMLSQGDNSLVAIPVFPSRMFRLSSFFIRRDGPVLTPADLRGKRVGYPDWSHTAGIFARGYLAEEAGIGIDEIEWVQAGVNEPGRPELMRIALGPDVRRVSRPETSLDAMLLSGEVDALLTSQAPKSSFVSGSGIVRLFPDIMAEETAYFRKTGIFPIMHVVALKRAVYEAHPWAAMNLYRAFEEAKRRSLARMRDATISRYPFPWVFELARQAESLFGADFWPYGIDANRRTLTAFLRFCRDQGVAHGPVEIEDLFPPEVRSTFKV